MSEPFSLPITAARPAFYTPEQRAEWERVAVKREIAALRQEIALAEAKAQRLNESIKARKSSLARLESQAVISAPVRSSVTMSVITCR